VLKISNKFKKSEISKYQYYKWVVQDLLGLYIHKGIVKLSRDPEVKELYQEMEEALIEEGNQPKAVQISEQIQTRITTNTIERLPV